METGRLDGTSVIVPKGGSIQEKGYGSPTARGIALSVLEAAFLHEKEKLEVKDGRGRKLTHEQLLKKAARSDKRFRIKYPVFVDLRKRGYVVKTALKYGADFRVYDKGVKPGGDHARWVVYPVHESETMTWQEFSAKNRVAHSTKKHLLLAVVDDEQDVTYWEAKWIKP